MQNGAPITASSNQKIGLVGVNIKGDVTPLHNHYPESLFGSSLNVAAWLPKNTDYFSKGNVKGEVECGAIATTFDCVCCARFLALS